MSSKKLKFQKQLQQKQALLAAARARLGVSPNSSESTTANAYSSFDRIAIKQKKKVLNKEIQHFKSTSVVSDTKQVKAYKNTIESNHEADRIEKNSKFTDERIRVTSRNAGFVQEAAKIAQIRAELTHQNKSTFGEDVVPGQAIENRRSDKEIYSEVIAKSKEAKLERKLLKRETEKQVSSLDLVFNNVLTSINQLEQETRSKEEANAEKSARLVSRVKANTLNQIDRYDKDYKQTMYELENDAKIAAKKTAATMNDVIREGYKRLQELDERRKKGEEVDDVIDIIETKPIDQKEKKNENENENENNKEEELNDQRLSAQAENIEDQFGIANDIDEEEDDDEEEIDEDDEENEESEKSEEFSDEENEKISKKKLSVLKNIVDNIKVDIETKETKIILSNALKELPFVLDVPMEYQEYSSILNSVLPTEEIAVHDRFIKSNSIAIDKANESKMSRLASYSLRRFMELSSFSTLMTHEEYLAEKAKLNKEEKDLTSANIEDDRENDSGVSITEKQKEQFMINALNQIRTKEASLREVTIDDIQLRIDAVMRCIRHAATELPNHVTGLIRNQLLSTFVYITQASGVKNNKIQLPLAPLMLLRLVTRLFPLGEKLELGANHPVYTPAVLLLELLIPKCRTTSLRDLLILLMLAQISASYAAHTGFYMASAIMALEKLLTSCHDYVLKHSDIFNKINQNIKINKISFDVLVYTDDDDGDDKQKIITTVPVILESICNIITVLIDLYEPTTIIVKAVAEIKYMTDGIIGMSEVFCEILQKMKDYQNDFSSCLSCFNGISETYCITIKLLETFAPIHLSQTFLEKNREGGALMWLPPKLPALKEYRPSYSIEFNPFRNKDSIDKEKYIKERELKKEKRAIKDKHRESVRAVKLMALQKTNNIMEIRKKRADAQKSVSKVLQNDSLQTKEFQRLNDILKNGRHKTTGNKAGKPNKIKR